MFAYKEMTESLYYFAGAAAANVLINGADFSSGTLLSLAGPLGATAGAWAGAMIAVKVAPGDDNKWLAYGIPAAAAIAVCVYGGADMQSAAVMVIGGGAAAMLLV